MIIVSQDGTELINFDNIVRLSIDVNTSGEFLIEAHNFCDDFETVIGFYETEERAKEVLQEIRKTYDDENCEFENGMYHMQRTYEMPEK